MYKTIERYPDYEINENGDIRKKGSAINRKTYISNNGHKAIKFTFKGKKEYVSKLVAETYIPNPNNKPIVRHLDGDTENNSISNLEWSDKWVTQKDSYGLGVNAPGEDKAPKQIQIVETGEIFPSIRACARAIGGSPSGIRQCLKNQLYSYKGYRFKLL